MIEKVNPMHPDKIADRIAGAIVDLAYTKNNNPKIAVEVLIGHWQAFIIIETSETFTDSEITFIVHRIAGEVKTKILVVSQDEHLSRNQNETIKAGDNGIFKGAPLSEEDKELSRIARDIYSKYGTDGKYVLDGEKLIICQSYAKEELNQNYPSAIINPLGYWTGGISVDSGATNRKLGSDMGSSITGGGLHGKDLSKADVSVNIYAFLKAQRLNKTVEISCAIGDEYVDGIEYGYIVEMAREYIKQVSGFEKFAEWGLY
jgi:S-adenosylmethionine synthetase